MIGLEPIRLSTPEPKSGAATNYATSVFVTPENYDISTPVLKARCSTFELRGHLFDKHTNYRLIKTS